MANLMTLVHEEDWTTMTSSHPADEIKRFVLSALDLRDEEVRVEADHLVWVSCAKNWDDRPLGPIQYNHRRRVMQWYEAHIAGTIRGT
jgi:hypothetical protein